MIKTATFFMLGLVWGTWGQSAVSPLVRQRLADSLSKTDFAKGTDLILEVVDKAEIFKRYPVQGFVGAGTGGVVFRAGSEDSQLVAKVLFDNSSYVGCRDNLIIKKLQDKDIVFVNKLIDYATDQRASGGKNFYLCILILEMGTKDLSQGSIFKNESPSNWPALLEFLGKVILSFAEINFKGKILHGDIKPQNILLVEKIDSIEPAVIDFDIMLDQSQGGNTNDCQLRYAARYRPREILALSTTNSKDDIAKWKANCGNYYYSSRFVEDVYALATTISRIMINNQRSLDPTHLSYQLFLGLLEKMLKPRASRLSMVQVLREYLDIVSKAGLRSKDIEFIRMRADKLAAGLTIDSPLF